MEASEGFAADVRGAAAGDESAWRRLHARFLPVLERTVGEFITDESPDLSVQDLTQEVWLRVVQQLGQFVGGTTDQDTEAMFRNWFHQTARNWVLNVLASRRTQRRYPSAPLQRIDQVADQSSKVSGIQLCGESATPSEISCRIEENSWVRRAVAEIPDALDRRIIESCFMDGESLAVIAARWQLSYDETRRRFHATLAMLQRKLEALS